MTVRTLVLMMMMMRRVLVRGISVVAPGDGQSFVTANVKARVPLLFEAAQDKVCVAVNSAAESCVEGGVSRVFLENMPVGEHTLRVRRCCDDAGTSLRVKVEAKKADVFEASYDWRDIEDAEAVPAGLEVRLPLSDEAKKTARIPEPWRLQLFVDAAQVFWRTDVSRDTPVASLEADLQELARSRSIAGRPRLAYSDGAPLHPKATAQDIDLFRHQHHLTIHWHDHADDVAAGEPPAPFVGAAPDERPPSATEVPTAPTPSTTTAAA